MYNLNNKLMIKKKIRIIKTMKQNMIVTLIKKIMSLIVNMI